MCLQSFEPLRTSIALLSAAKDIVIAHNPMVMPVEDVCLGCWITLGAEWSPLPPFESLPRGSWVRGNGLITVPMDHSFPGFWLSSISTSVLMSPSKGDVCIT